MAQKINLKKLLESNFKDIKSDVSFENGIELLEELVEKVESGALPLEQAITAYEAGANLVLHLKKHLGDAEKKLDLIKVN